MKERRHAGATHSFRLTPAAAAIVNSINHPRRLGGKSAKVSEAIEAYFGKRLDTGHEQPSYEQLLQNISGLQNVIQGLHIDIEALKERNELYRFNSDDLHELWSYIDIEALKEGNASSKVKDELHQFTSTGQIADNEVDNSVPTPRGWKRFFGFFKRN